MKRSVCSQLMFVILFVLQSQKLLTNSQVSEYSELHIVKSLSGEHHHAHPQPEHIKNNHQYHQQQIHNHNNHYHQQQQLQQQHQHQHPHQNHPQHMQLPNDGVHVYNEQQFHLQSNQQSPHAAAHHQEQGQQNPPTQYQQAYQQQQQAQNQYHYPHKQQPQQNLHQNQQRLDHLYHHSSQASDMQQVLSGQPYQYHAHHIIGLKHEITPEGESLAYTNSYEAAYPVIQQQVNRLSYYQWSYHHQKSSEIEHTSSAHIIAYSGSLFDDSIYDDDRPDDSCHVQPNLWQANFQQPTCEKDPTSAVGHGVTSSSQNVPNLSHLTNKPSHNSNVESFPLTPQHYHYESSLMGAIRHYWREVSGLCLASAIFLNWLFVVIKRRFVDCGLSRADHAIESVGQTTSKSVFKDTNSSAQDSAFEETASPLSLDDIESSKSLSDHPDKSTNSVQSVPFRQRSSTLRAEPIPIPVKSPGHNSLSASLSNSLNTSEYNSRYSSDFDSIQRLGRGGFGIVFEAKNKIDDCHYAVKRICLPLEKEARERVMREVRALAKLDHAGIVRYYNAWLETPPDEWLKQHDAQLGIVHSKDGLNFPSTDGIYERNESEQISKGSNGNLGESGDNSSGLFGGGPFKRRTNGFRKYLKNNSSSPSLDIVFEGSGSIRLESENNTEKTDSSKSTPRNSMLLDGNDGDNISDSEDFIQIKPRGNNKNDLDGGELSQASQLSDPFSSSDDDDDDHVEDNEDESSSLDTDDKQVVKKKHALIQQKEMRERQLNQSSLMDNSHGEKVYLYIQMQLCRKDTLKDWLKTNCEQRDKTTIFDLFYQIVDAVEYVHSQDLIHRDLKPSNIFFSLDGTLKIGDFGLCRTKTATTIGSSLDLQEYVAESDVERSFEAVHTEQVGTQLYMSPEQLNGLSYNQKVDIFAMGLILLELLVPFKTQMQRVNVLFKARNNLYSDEFRNDHPQEHELVKTLLSRSPLKRPTATEIKQHELLASAQLSQPVIERIYHRRRTISSNSSTE